MKKYQVFAISRTYYSIEVDANSREEALIIIEGMKKPKFKLERIEPIEIIENSVQRVNDNPNDKPNNI